MNIRPNQLTFAREFRRYSQSDLATQIKGLSQSNLSKFEKGFETYISDEVLQRIIKFLNFPVEFFQKKINLDLENVDYRKKSVITKKTQREIDSNIKMIAFIIDNLSESIDWPEFNYELKDLDDGFSPEKIANYARRVMKIPPDEPIHDINTVVEKSGILIAEMDADEKFDGAAILTTNGLPVIVTNANFDNDRKRFTIAHELGHVLMHSAFLISSFRDKELEANRFASEFLMPAKAIKGSLYNLKLSELASLKRYWLTSMASIMRRAKDLGCIDDDRYKYFCIEMSRRGERKRESVRVTIDKPNLISMAYELHKSQLMYSKEEISKAFSIPLDVQEKFLEKRKDNIIRLKNNVRSNI
ncbi:helix-turn-helix domain-containing protein [Portibacter marinus]|uniref:helix-turn-helix domain-containing protein n=1 Tax=Portibacter marinus TaxID=2898660 RepID=UPI001F21ECEA|nr:XRE family transcriptional regulator [Portibacter marinus]